MVREFLALFTKREVKQAAVLATIPVPRSEQPAMKEGTQAAFEGHIRFQRLSYAEEQAKWEWEHNKAARDAYQRQKDGFL